MSSTGKKGVWEVLENSVWGSPRPQLTVFGAAPVLNSQCLGQPPSSTHSVWGSPSCGLGASRGNIYIMENNSLKHYHPPPIPGPLPYLPLLLSLWKNLNSWRWIFSLKYYTYWFPHNHNKVMANNFKVIIYVVCSAILSVAKIIITQVRCHFMGAGAPTWLNCYNSMIISRLINPQIYQVSN